MHSSILALSLFIVSFFFFLQKSFLSPFLEERKVASNPLFTETQEGRDGRKGKKAHCWNEHLEQQIRCKGNFFDAIY
jgi:hypothetical protein